MNTLYSMITGREAVVATQHDLSSAAGARMFARGGNAIDAAVAATLVESVVNPHMFTLGGESPILLYSASSGRAISVSGQMVAPARATIAEYHRRGLDLIPADGLLAAGVPAVFDALMAVLADFGVMSFADVSAPALELCESGFPAHDGLIGYEAVRIPITTVVNSHVGPICTNVERFSKEWPTSGAIYLPGGKVPEPGVLIRNPALADCFRRLLDAEAAARSRGRDDALQAVRDRFYRGDIAREIADWSKRNDGLIEVEDLAKFATRYEQPIAAEYHGFTVFKCPPWTQGPVFLQHLRLLDGVDLRAMGHNSPDYIHFVTETAKLAFADREAYYADPDFVRVPMEELLAKEYADLRRSLIDQKRASLDFRPGDPTHMRAIGEPPPGMPRWDSGTVHVDAADHKGNLIAITASGAWIQSSPVIDTLGFPLGSRMQTFYLDERHPNALVPGKRPRTTLSPSLAMRDGEYLAFGTTGGDQQDQWTLQFFLNVVDFGMNLQEAIEAPKFSTRHFPSTFNPHDAIVDSLRLEERIDESVRAELAARGHRVEIRPAYSEGYVLAVEIDRRRGLLMGGADPRGHLAGTFPSRSIGW